jgi:hypothetical protein
METHTTGAGILSKDRASPASTTLKRQFREKFPVGVGEFAGNRIFE